VAGQCHRLGRVNRDLERQIVGINRRLREGHADHPHIPLLRTAPGIGWVLAFTTAAEIGEIERFSSPRIDRRHRPLRARQPVGPLRPASAANQARSTLPALGLIEATMHALKHPADAERYQPNKRRLGKQRWPAPVRSV
jgi:transposase